MYSIFSLSPHIKNTTIIKLQENISIEFFSHFFFSFDFVNKKNYY